MSFISFMYLPFYTKGEFRVPDNWWHSRDFHNLPLYEFSLALLRALRKGYTATLAVDFSEPGYLGESDVAMVPTFDIPSSLHRPVQPGVPVRERHRRPTTTPSTASATWSPARATGS